MTAFNRGRWLLDVHQPAISAQRLESNKSALTRYRIMAVITGVVLLAGTIALILKYTTNLHLEPGTGILWLAHGYLYLVYVIITAILGFRLRWPPARYVLVMLAGTIPTMSFVAEHFVTRQTRAAASAQPVSARD